MWFAGRGCEMPSEASLSVEAAAHEEQTSQGVVSVLF